MTDDEGHGPDEARPSPEESKVAARVRPAALVLTTVCLLNLMAGVYSLVTSILDKQQGPDAEWQQRWDAMDPALREWLVKNGWNSGEFYVAAANGLLWYGGVASLLSVLALAGARHMLVLRSYRLAMTSAVLTAIPCVTPCCLLGQIAGIWAVIVLMQPDVRRAFQ
jgi:hypothetical protein